MPAESGDDVMYNVGMVAAILEEFMLQHKMNGSEAKLQEDDDNMDVAADSVITSSKLVAVTKLVDGSLS